MKKKQYAWHFLSDKDGHPVYRDGKPAKIGDVLTHDGPLVICRSGLHYSRRAIDAVSYAPGPWLCRVEIGGAEDQDDDKGVCRSRRVVWMADVSEILRPFGRWCAATVMDKWDPPEIVVRWLMTGGESIRAAARAAAGAAAWAAAWAAAGDAAWAAAGDAAGAAAWDAAGDAAGDAARAAAGAAAGDAARDAAVDAARAAQNELLEHALRIAGAYDYEEGG